MTFICRKFEAGFDLKCQNLKELLDQFDLLISTLTILINTPHFLTKGSQMSLIHLNKLLHLCPPRLRTESVVYRTFLKASHTLTLMSMNLCMGSYHCSSTTLASRPQHRNTQPRCALPADSRFSSVSTDKSEICLF